MAPPPSTQFAHVDPESVFVTALLRVDGAFDNCHRVLLDVNARTYVGGLPCEPVVVFVRRRDGAVFYQQNQRDDSEKSAQLWRVVEDEVGPDSYPADVLDDDELVWEGPQCCKQLRGVVSTPETGRLMFACAGCVEALYDQDGQSIPAFEGKHADGYGGHALNWEAVVLPTGEILPFEIGGSSLEEVTARAHPDGWDVVTRPYASSFDPLLWTVGFDASSELVGPYPPGQMNTQLAFTEQCELDADRSLVCLVNDGERPDLGNNPDPVRADPNGIERWTVGGASEVFLYEEGLDMVIGSILTAR